MVLAACGVPTQRKAQVIPNSEVPYNLLSPVAPTTTTSAPTGYVKVSAYLIQTSQDALSSVHEVTRYVAPPGSLTAIIDVLLRGPTTCELQNGIVTALNGSVKLLASHVVGKMATVDFNTAFALISGPLDVLAVAQVVYTVAGELGPGTGVQFQISGINTDVPIASGALVSRPVHVADYASLAPNPNATTSCPG